MTMMAPQSYVDDLEGESYEQMIKERDKLIREIRHFEKHREEIMNMVFRTLLKSVFEMFNRCFWLGV